MITGENKGCSMMSIMSVVEAQPKLPQLIDMANTMDEVVTISSEQGNAILISEEKWLAIQQKLMQQIPIQGGGEYPMAALTSSWAMADDNDIDWYWS